jgi:hypothetical protein
MWVCGLWAPSTGVISSAHEYGPTHSHTAHESARNKLNVDKKLVEEDGLNPDIVPAAVQAASCATDSPYTQGARK